MSDVDRILAEVVAEQNARYARILSAGVFVPEPRTSLWLRIVRLFGRPR